MPLKQLVYVSAARRHLPDAEYSHILASARQRNAEAGITGVLLTIENGFLQILEGEPEAVDATFDRILRDTRHTGVRKLYDEPADMRSFSNWSMGFDDLRGRDVQAAGSFPLSKAAMADTLPSGLGAEILILVKTFYAVNAAA